MSLHIQNVQAGYGKTPVLTGINLHAEPGDFIGLVGPNGSGKSCLIKAIAGLLPLQNGQILAGLQDISQIALRKRARVLAYLPQERTASWALSVRDLVALGRAPYRGALGRISQGGEAAIDDALARAQCADLAARRFDRLSGGEQARVHLARALAVQAPIFLADEPAASLDPFYQIAMMQTLAAEAASGKTVITSVHDLSLAKQFCSRIWVLSSGRIAQDTPSADALGADILSNVFHIRRDGGGYALSSQ